MLLWYAAMKDQEQQLCCSSRWAPEEVKVRESSYVLATTEETEERLQNPPVLEDDERVKVEGRA
jgi:hypothetical protein